MKYPALLRNPLFIGGIFVLLCIIITGQNLLLRSETFLAGMGYTHYNNYTIFKQSFFHLIHNKDLYQLYPAEYWDYFKYSPTFALLMAPMAVLPDFAGLLFWNLLNVMVLFVALWKIPGNSDKSRIFMLLFVVIELVNSVQTSQSNVLIAGLILLAFIFFEKKKPAWATLFIVLTIFIKLFSGISLILLLFYPDKRKTLLYTCGWVVLLALLPLMVVSLHQLFFLYQSWYHLLLADQSASWGLSVSGLLHTWFGVDLKNIVLAAGLLFFCLPLINVKQYKAERFRLFYLAFLMIWIIIFNYKAEPPSYIIAIAGTAIWFFVQPLKTVNLILLILAAILTILSPTDLFPVYFRDKYVDPYMLKALPCILVWIKITFDLVFFGKKDDLTDSVLHATKVLHKR